MYRYFCIPHTQDSQAWSTQCYMQLHQCLPLSRKRSPDGASPDWGCGHLVAACCSFIYPKEWKAENIGLVGWPIANGLPTLSGHPSAACQGQESSPVKDQHSTNCVTQPTMYNVREQLQPSDVVCDQLFLLLYSTGRTFMWYCAQTVSDSLVSCSCNCRT